MFSTSLVCFVAVCMSVGLCVIVSLLEAHLLFACALVSSSYGIRRSFYSGLGAAVKYFHLVASTVISHPMWVLPFSCSILNSLLWTLPYRPSSLDSFITFCFLVFVWCRGHLSQPFSNGLYRLKAYLYFKLLLSLRCTSVGLTYCARSPCMHTCILDDMSKHDYASIE